jgi:hypothetical protein
VLFHILSQKFNLDKINVDIQVISLLLDSYREDLRRKCYVGHKVCISFFGTTFVRELLVLINIQRVLLEMFSEMPVGLYGK